MANICEREPSIYLVKRGWTCLQNSMMIKFSVIFLFLSNVNADFIVRKDLRSILEYNHDIQIDNLIDPVICTDLLDKFADAASNFTKCSIKHARPVRLCAKCSEQYVTFRDRYKDLVTTNVNGTKCKSLFISHDRLDAVLEYHDDIQGVWDKGNCNECFDWDNNDIPKLSNDTITFYKMFNDTLDCIAENMNDTTANNTKLVCETCMPKYIKLDEFYKSLSADGIGVDTVCMDIVDSMNATRAIWSKVLDCCNLRRSPEIVFLCCTAIMGILPILFYIAVRFCGPIRDLPNVLKQSRFKQMILRSSERTIN